MAGITQRFLSRSSNLSFVLNLSRVHTYFTPCARYRFLNSHSAARNPNNMSGCLCVLDKSFSLKKLHIQESFYLHVEFASKKIRILCPSRMLSQCPADQRKEIILK